MLMQFNYDMLRDLNGCGSILFLGLVVIQNDYTSAFGLEDNMVYGIIGWGRFWDCGEFISACYKMQIMHPPGAPFFMLTGRMFTLLAADPSQVAWGWLASILGGEEDVA